MEKFYFFNSFLDTAKAIEDKDLRLEYLMAVAEYGIEAKEPTNPIVKALMVQTKFTLDRSKELSQQKSEYMKGNQNAVKTFEKALKQRKSENIRPKQKKQEEEVEEEKENKKKNNKKKFLDFVLLTDKEYNSLVTLFGERTANELIDRLNNYIGSTGKRYKSHYFTLLNWSKKDDNITTTPEREDDVDTAVQKLSDRNLKSKMEFEIQQRRKNGLSVNMQIYENILNRLIQHNGRN